MSLHRRAVKRDKAEPAIVKTLEAHGCLVWTLSGKGIPDLLVFYRRRRNVRPEAEVVRHTFVADVKGPKEKPTPAQVEKWTALTNLGFAVFILRTPEDAVAMLNNALQPWEPENCVNQQPRSEESRKHLAQIAKSTQETVRRKRLAGLRGQEMHEKVPGGLKKLRLPRKGDPAKAREAFRCPHGADCVHRCSPANVERKTCGCVRTPAGCEHDDYTPPRSTPVDAAKEAEATFAPEDEKHQAHCDSWVGRRCTCYAADSGASGMG